MRPVVAILSLLALLILPLSGQAGAPDKPPKPEPPGQAKKLDVPTNITCTKAADQLTVSWAPVTGATAYKLTLEAGTDDEGEGTVPASPYTQAISDLTDNPTEPITVKVRSMRTEKSMKGASKPSAAMPCTGG